VSQLRESSHRRYVAYGVIAYGLWGLLPLYFKTVTQVAPAELLVHRVLWSFVMLAVAVCLLHRWNEVWRELHNPRLALLLGLSSLLLAGNWLTFIYSVVSGQVLQSSLGYFISPLLNVLLGVVFFRERLWPFQIVSIGVAAVGVLLFAGLVGQIPWIALTLAVTGTFYGVLRKIMPIDALLSITVETLIIVPVALAYLAYLAATDKGTGNSAGVIALLALSGPVTTVPFLFFGAAARRLRLSTMGIIQYLSPSLQFLVAVAVFKESFSTAQFASFACIWTAVGIYVADSYRAARQARLGPVEPLMMDP
jgi:chloramphenicol-sensitive protein RarD